MLFLKIKDFLFQQVNQPCDLKTEIKILTKNKLLKYENEIINFLLFFFQFNVQYMQEQKNF